MSDEEFAERHCPLPVVRKRLDEEGEHYELAVERCDAPLHVSYERMNNLLAGGEGDGCGETWKVECGNGHVLVVPDHEGDDDMGAIPFRLGLAEEALAWVDGSEAAARVRVLQGALGESLGQFHERGHPGTPCLRSGWVDVATVDGWRRALAGAGAGG
jgi:hypothetical protein